MLVLLFLDHHQGYSQQQLAQIRDMEHTSSKRSQEIESIVKSINDLAELFKELSVLVVEQVPICVIPASCFFTMPFRHVSGRSLRISPFIISLTDFELLQGSMLDRIDYNIESTLSSLKDGHKELDKVCR